VRDDSRTISRRAPSAGVRRSAGRQAVDARPAGKPS
jgi:hypothetical protein